MAGKWTDTVLLTSNGLYLQPNSMGIDPADDRCVPFYHKMKELDLVSGPM